MIKSFCVVAAASASLVLPAAAESYVRGDGCGGTYVDRRSEMMAGNITGGTRYKCTPFPQRTQTNTAPRLSTSTYSIPTTTTQVYTAPRQTYSYGHTSYTSQPRTTYSGHGYASRRPHSNYHSNSQYVTTHPQTTYSTGQYGYSSGTTYTSQGGSYVNTTPRTVYSTGSGSYHSGTHGTVTTRPQTHYNTRGVPRVTGNLANSYTTTIPSDGNPNVEFSLGRPETYTRTDQ